MGSLRNKVLGITLLLFAAVACREPRSAENFVPGGGPYTFSIDMADTLKVYDFSLYTRLDGSPEDLGPIQEVLLWMDWISPSGQKAAEKVYMPLKGRSSFFSRQVLVPYRADMRPAEPGEWTLVITPVSPPEELVGMGLIVTKRPWDTEN